MPGVAQYSAYAQAALAAYATGLLADEDNASRYEAPDRMSASQASEFDAKWNVVQQSTSANGFSAVLLQNSTTGEKVLAIAGTDPGSPMDWFNDALVVQYGTALGMPQYSSLESFYQQLVADGKLGANEQIIVTGHSLGGFLAQAFTTRHASAVSAAYTYNAPGFGNTESLLGFFGVTDTSASVKITNVHATDGPSIVAGLGVLLGASQGVRIEEDTANPTSNHSIARLGDALAVYNVYANLQPEVRLSQIETQVISAGFRDRRLEDALDALRTVFIDSASNDANRTPTGDRDRFYINLQALQNDAGFNNLSGQVQLVQASTAFASAAQASTSTALAYRYALLEFAPFAVVANTDVQNQSLYGAYTQRLTLYDESTGQGELTRTWLIDRASMLDWLTLRNTKNIASVLTAGNSGRTISQATNFEDRASATQILVGATDQLNQRVQILFGGDAVDPLTGYGRDDRLYGGVGDDFLVGQGGADYLQGDTGDDDLDGGAGNDTLWGGEGQDIYRFNGSFGVDTITDQDGNGILRLDGQTLSAGKKVVDGVYQNTDRSVTYTVIKTSASTPDAPLTQDLIISFKDRKDAIVVKNWNPLDLGITLDDTAPVPPVTAQTLDGDFKKKTNSAGTQYEFVTDPATGRTNYVADGPETGAADMIVGYNSDDTILGLLGDDALIGYDGDDYIDGGTGGDVLQGGKGRDWLIGGVGDDVLFGSSEGSFQHEASVDFVPPEATYPTLLARGFNWLNESSGVDPEGIPQGYLSLTISRDDTAETEGNVLDGGAGFDAIFAGTGNDIVNGGADVDEIFGMDGADILIGGAGIDRIYGDGTVDTSLNLIADVDGPMHGADVIDGGEGNDVLLGQGSDDIIYGGADDDKLFGDDRSTADTPAEFNGNDWLDGGLGNDKAWGGGGNDTVFGGAGNDYLDGDWDPLDLAPQWNGSDWLDGGTGDDIIYGAGGNDTLLGGDDNDYLNGDGELQFLAAAWHGDDVLDGGNGNDDIIGGGGNDTLYGGAGDDTLSGDDLLSPTGTSSLNGNDWMDGGAGNDLLMGGNGNDTLIAGEGQNALYGGKGDDLLIGTLGLDLLDGGEGIDTYRVKSGVIDTSSGEPVLMVSKIIANDGADIIQLEGISSADLTINYTIQGSLALRNANSGVAIEGGNQSNAATVELTDGSFSYRRLLNERLDAQVTATSERSGGTLIGGMRADTLTARTGDTGTVISAGLGNDQIVLNTGDGATVQFARGDGVDTVAAVARNAQQAITPKNVLQLDAGISPADVILVWRANGSQTLSLGAGDGIAFQLTGHAAAQDVPQQAWPFDEIRFADGTVNTMADVLARGVAIMPIPTAGDDIATLTPIDDQFDALAGNDWVDGGSGNDSINGNDGDDVLLGGDGNDTLTGWYGSNRLLGGAGEDTLVSFGRYDPLQTATGRETLEGGEDTDRYVLAADTEGAAIDTSSTSGDRYEFDARGSWGSNWTLDDFGGVDTVAIEVEPPGPWTVPPAFRFDGQAVVVSTGSSTLKINGMVRPDGTLDPDRMIESLTFSSGLAMSAEDVRAALLVGTAQADGILGFDTNDAINGDADYDWIHGGAGDDTLSAGPSGGALIGGLGNDTYVLNGGDGFVSIPDLRDYIDTSAYVPQSVRLPGTNGHAGTDTLRVQAPRAETTIFLDGNGLMVAFADGSASARMALIDADETGGVPVEWFEFSDGSNLTLDEVLTPIRGLPTSADDTITGTTLRETLVGLAGNDTILANDGYADIIDGGTGNDTFTVDLNDVVLHRRGDGVDLSNALEFWGYGVPTNPFPDSRRIDFGAGVLASDVSVQWVAANRIEFSLGADDSVQVDLSKPNASGTGMPLKRALPNEVRFTDGTSWSRVDLINKLTNGGDGSDELFVFEGGVEYGYFEYEHSNQPLTGGGGNDILHGSSSGATIPNMLIGGAGDDTLYSGLGTVSYQFDVGFGNDTIITTGGRSGAVTQTVSFGVGLNSADVTVTARVGGIAALTFNSTGDSVGLERFLQSDGSGLGTASDHIFHFADDTTWTAIDVFQRIQQIATPFADLLHGTASTDVLDGLAGDDWIYGLAGNDELSGGTGADQIWGGDGNDTLNGGDDNDVLDGEAGDDTLSGGNGDDQLLGGAGSNTLLGGAGNDYLAGSILADYLDGGSGNDTLFGFSGDGSDVYVFSAGWGTDYLPGVNTDEIRFDASVASTDVKLWRMAGSQHMQLTHDPSGASMQVDNYFAASPPSASTITFAGGTVWSYSTALTKVAGIMGTANAETITALSTGGEIRGLGGNDTLNGSAVVDILDGGTGNDRMSGGAGDDIYIVDATGDQAIESASAGTDTVRSTIAWTLGSNIENLELLGSAPINGTGNSLANTLRGNSADNTLDGGTGNDTMIGGAGNDTYVFNVATDAVTELANEGSDTILSSVTLSLAAIANVENLTLTGSGAINATGNALNNTLTGNSGNNTLDGGAGSDTLAGGAGNDTYVVDSAGDTITENTGGGTDLVQASVSWTLAAETENLTLTGTSAISATGNALANAINGNSGNNILSGGAGNDTLTGGAGTDTLVGGAGDDIYVVDVTGDVVTELANEGIDTVQSGITWTLASTANVENLTLTGSGVVNGTGNALDNVLTGNSANNTLTGSAGNDTLNGGTGNDTMIGGAGNDTYVVNVSTDVVTEAANEGIDTIQSAVTLSLAALASVENLTLTGSSAINATGNALDNVLTGNSGVNVLTGGAGNDTYAVTTGDTTTEAASAGTDLVMSAVTWTLATNLENLTLTGTAAVNGTGNTVANVLVGNSGVNTLTGNAGNDTLDGGAGNDALNGGTGADTYNFGRGYGTDTITDGDATAGVVDQVQFGAAVLVPDVVYTRNGNNLEATISGTPDKLIVQNWYLGAAYQVEQFRYADGSVRTAAQVQAAAAGGGTAAGAVTAGVGAVARTALSTGGFGLGMLDLMRAMQAPDMRVALDPSLALRDAQAQRLIEAMSTFGAGAAADGAALMPGERIQPWRGHAELAVPMM